jgi:hypothetical protein
MIGAAGQVATFKLTLGDFTKQLEQALMVELHRATAAWLRAVLLQIPIYTGTAKGTFGPLSRFLKVPNPFAAPVDARAARKKVFRYKGQEWPLGYKEGFSYGDAGKFEMQSTFNSRIMIFKFINLLPYVLWNDMYPAPAWLHLPSNPPWEALSGGANAFYLYVRDEIPKRLPSLAGCLSVQIIRIR